MTKLLLATNNQGKVREYKMLLRSLPYELVTLAESGLTQVSEAGKSLEPVVGLDGRTVATYAGTNAAHYTFNAGLRASGTFVVRVDSRHGNVTRKIVCQ